MIPKDLDPRDLREPALTFARAHGVTLEALFSASRESNACSARHEFWAYLISDRGWSQSDVARYFGRSPSTVNKTLSRRSSPWS